MSTPNAGIESASAVALVGNNVAVMVAALDLAMRDVPVVLLNPAPGWGGHFAGIELNGWHFDPGMVLYEFDAFNLESDPALASYDPERRNDCGRFFGVVREYIERRIGMARTLPPMMFFRGGMHPDLIIGNQMDVLAHLEDDERNRVRAQLEAICARRDPHMHASQKVRDTRFSRFDYAAVSVANHGETLHEIFFEPLCRKILGVASREILGIYHRVPWLPLYYPETLLSQFGPESQRLPATPFYYPSAGSAGALSVQLATEILAHPRIRVVREAVTALEWPDASPAVLRCSDGTLITAEKMIWGLDADALIAAADPAAQSGPFARGSIGLCFLAVPAATVKRGFGTLLVPEPEHAIYRVTNQDACAGSDAMTHRLVVEFSPQALAQRGILESAAQGDAIVRELAGMGLIESPGAVAYCSVKLMKNALTIPNMENRDLFNRQQAWIRERFPEVRLAGPAAGFLVASLNDQIVQGLKTGDELGGSKN